MGPILVMCIGDEAAGESVLGTIGGKVVSVIKFCDRFSDPFHKLGVGLKVVKKSTGKLFVYLQKGTENIIEQLENTHYKIKALVEGNLQWVEIPEGQLELAMQTADGAEKSIQYFDEASKNLVTKNLKLFVEGLENTYETLAKKIGFSEAFVRGLEQKGVPYNKIAQFADKFPGRDNLFKQIDNMAAQLADPEKAKRLADALLDDNSLPSKMLNENRLADLDPQAWGSLIKSYPLAANTEAIVNKLKATIERGVKGIDANYIEVLIKTNAALKKKEIFIEDFVEIIDGIAAKQMVGINENAIESLANAWKALGKRVTQRKSIDYLIKADQILKSKKLGISVDDLAKISEVHLNTGAACGNCINSFDKTLENIKNIENYIDKPEDFKKILTNLTNNTNNFRGADWALQVVKEKPIVGKITGFEVKLNDAENFTADIIAKQGNLEFYYECKNYSGAVNYLTSSGSNFIDQFTNYLTKSTKLEQVNYFFHSRYAGDLKADIIAALKSTKGTEALNNPNILKLFDNYAESIQSSINISTIDDLKNFIYSNNDWFNLIFEK